MGGGGSVVGRRKRGRRDETRAENHNDLLSSYLDSRSPPDARAGLGRASLSATIPKHRAVALHIPDVDTSASPFQLQPLLFRRIP